MEFIKHRWATLSILLLFAVLVLDFFVADRAYSAPFFTSVYKTQDYDFIVAAIYLSVVFAALLAALVTVVGVLHYISEHSFYHPETEKISKVGVYMLSIWPVLYAVDWIFTDEYEVTKFVAVIVILFFVFTAWELSKSIRLWELSKSVRLSVQDSWERGGTWAKRLDVPLSGELTTVWDVHVFEGSAKIHAETYNTIEQANWRAEQLRVEGNGKHRVSVHRRQK